MSTYVQSVGNEDTLAHHQVHGRTPAPAGGTGFGPGSSVPLSALGHGRRPSDGSCTTTQPWLFRHPRQHLGVQSKSERPNSGAIAARLVPLGLGPEPRPGRAGGEAILGGLGPLSVAGRHWGQSLPNTGFFTFCAKARDRSRKWEIRYRESLGGPWGWFSAWCRECSVGFAGGDREKV